MRVEIILRGCFNEETADQWVADNVCGGYEIIDDDE